MRSVILGLVVGLIATAACAGDKLQIAPAEPWVKPLALPTTLSNDEASKPVRTLVSEIQVKFDDQAEHIYQHTASRIQTPAGLATANLAVSWRPDVESLTVNEVRILRGDQTIDVLATQQFTVLRREANLDRAMLDGALTATLQPAGLQVGDTIEVAFTLTRHDPVMGGHAEAVFYLLPNVVVDHVQFRELWAADRPMKWRETDGLSPATLTKTPDGEELVMTEANAERAEPPKGAPARYSYLSVLEASDFQHWSDLSAQLAPLFDKASTLGPSSPLKSEAAKIRAASSDPKVQAAAALKLVQDQIRYLFLGMNLGGYSPADADTTWSRRFGDCKGKTVALLALLRELGIEAEPVLVSTVVGDGMDERLPDLELFDHVLVRAHIGGADYWLDGTRMGDRALDTIEPPPFRWGLPLRVGGGADLVKIEQRPSPTPLLETTISIDASAGLDAVAPAHVVSVFRGDAATVLKTAIATKSGDDLDKTLKDFANSAYSWMEVKTTVASFDEATGEERFVADGVTSMSWALNSAFHQREFEVAAGDLGFDPDFKRTDGSPKDAPYAVPFPMFVKAAETITLPQGGKGFTVAADDFDRTIGGVEYKRTSSIAGGVFSMTASARAVADEFPAAAAQATAAALRDLSSDHLLIRAPKDYVASDQELKLRIARTPTLASEYADRANAYVVKKDYPNAIKDFDAALKLNADDADLLNARCFTRAIENQGLDLALADCNAALDEKPRAPDILDSRGFVYFRMGALDKAMSDFNAALNVEPDQAATLYVRGLIERRRGDNAKAEADIAAAKTSDPTVVTTYAGYGVSR